jgi:isochorismate synthase / 2-succinyl-5-enolpyruvyl-6-hydroxy-3-cyclohexene-1-carboxylate synthase / 2-succinyl-6-hydroxy-2,4-cyclohexadiene-1-carboxylate synthase / o-succinylbenzoate synthase
VQPPTDAVPARTMLTTIDTAIHRCMGGSGGGGSGPVHLNCQFREPLAPSLQDWSRECLRGFERWQASNEPFTSIAASAGNVADMALFDGGLSLVGRDSLMVPDHGLQAALSAIQQSDRGLILMGELIDPVDIAAAVRIAQRLRWPVVADVLSGTKLGALPPAQGSSFALLSHFDHVLLDQASWRHLKPDVVLQIGGHVTSKRVCQFLEWCAAGGDDNSESSIPSDAYERSDVGSTAMQTRWIFVDRSPHRHDQAHLVGHRIQCPVAWFLTHLERRCMETPTSGPMQHQQQQLNRSGYNDALSENSAQSMYSLLLARLDAAACAAIDAAVAEFGDELTEPGIARLLSQELPHGEGVFIGNSMPIRDLDMYGMPAAGPRQQQADADRCVTPRADSNGHSRINGLDSSNGKTNGFVFASARDAEEECVDAEEKGVAMLLPQGHVASGMGAAVGANRGASGIDGVLSTAAGFADGLGRGTTLVVGDLSFLHDTNGLALLRSGECCCR